MTSDRAAIERTAELLVSRFGRDAAHEVARRVNGHISFGEIDSYRRWMLVLAAVRRLAPARPSFF